MENLSQISVGLNLEISARNWKLPQSLQFASFKWNERIEESFPFSHLQRLLDAGCHLLLVVLPKSNLESLELFASFQ